MRASMGQRAPPCCTHMGSQLPGWAGKEPLRAMAQGVEGSPSGTLTCPAQPAGISQEDVLGKRRQNLHLMLDGSGTVRSPPLSNMRLA